VNKDVRGKTEDVKKDIKEGGHEIELTPKS